MTQKITDLETAPAPNLIEIIEKYYPFDSDNVSGIQNNWKQETKDRHIEEARTNHIPKMLKKAQKDPLLSWICSIGTMDLGGSKPRLHVTTDPQQEIDLIRSLFSQMEYQGDVLQLIGWNFEDFDMEMLWMRAWLLGLKPPSRYRKGRYWNSDLVVDLRKIWSFGRMDFTSLEKVVKLLNCQAPNRPEGISGKDFWFLLNSDIREENELAIRYGESDLIEENSVAMKLI